MASGSTSFLVARLKASEKSITAAALVPQLIAAKKPDGASKRYVEDFAVAASSFRSSIRCKSARQS